MQKSPIEWTESTWNPVTGCTPVSPGCANCYAERMAKRLRGRCGYPADDPFRVTLHPDRLAEPLKWKKPRKVFVCSMGDLFHEDVPNGFRGAVWQTMTNAQQHIFQVLTKRPKEMARWYAENWQRDPLSNVWLGTSCENQATADERIPHLLDCSAAVRFISAEPLLGPLDLSGYFGGEYVGLPGDRVHKNYNAGIDWVIVGGESGPGARPMHPDWARDIRDQCVAAGVPCFFKQMSGKKPIPQDLLIREYPDG